VKVLAQKSYGKEGGKFSTITKSELGRRPNLRNVGGLKESLPLQQIKMTSSDRVTATTTNYRWPPVMFLIIT
jgi:hypothetical protein